MPKINYKHSEETKRKISVANKGKHRSEEFCNKMSENQRGEKNHQFGKRHSVETIKKMSIAKMGNRSTLGKHHSLETRRKMSEACKGEKCRFWKGGISAVNHKIRQSLEYRIWREAVFKRDNWTCVWCSAKSGKDKVVILNADHIKPFASYPELRFAIDNGRTLCLPCHKTTENYARHK